LNILAIETSLGLSSVALRLRRHTGGEEILAERLPQGAQPAEHLVPLIGAIMARGGLAFSQLDLIAVSVGPGGFSSIRTGVAAARAIGLAAKVPVAGATSFRVMAASMSKRHPGSAFGLAAPAGAQAAYCQLIAEDGRSITEIELVPAEEVGGFFEGRVDVLGGPPRLSFGQTISPLLPEDMIDASPDATILAEVASELDPSTDRPSPFYVRSAGARPQVGGTIARKAE